MQHINSIFPRQLVPRTPTLPAFGNTYTEKTKRMTLFAALLFGVHLIQTEAVTYIISRRELLSTFSCLATFLLFIRETTTGKFRYAEGALAAATPLSSND